MSAYRVFQTGAVTTIRTPKGGFKGFITSDVHFDSVFCNRQQFFKDMNSAIDIGYEIIIVGDFFDAMQGRFDPRRDMRHLRPEYRRKDYYDVIVKDALDQLKPYKKHIVMVTEGNHEQSVLKNAGTDLVDRLVTGLSTPANPTYKGGYGGWIRIQEERGMTPIKYFHGAGGEAPVTKGAIQTNRQAVFLPDAEVVLNGHSHNAYWIPLARERLSPNGQHYFDLQHHVRTPGYAMTYGDGMTGWEVTRGGVPKPIGGCYLDIKDCSIQYTPIIHPPSPISTIDDIFDGIAFPQE
jgi:hypothetical protein